MSLLRKILGAAILLLSDIFSLLLIVILAITIRDFLSVIFPKLPDLIIDINHAWWFFPAWLAILIYEGAYTKKFSFWEEVRMLWKVTLFSTLTLLAIFFLGKIGDIISRTVIVLIGLLSLITFPLLRTAVKRFLFRLGIGVNKALIIGANGTGRLALNALKKEKNLGYRVVGFVDEPAKTDASFIDGIRLHGHLQHVERYIKHCDIQDVVIALPELDKEQLAGLVNRLQHKATNILFFPGFSGMAVMGTELRHFFQEQIFALEIKNNLAQPLNYYAKRTFDYFLGLILFILLIIPMIMIALLIKLTSAGPAILKQKRIGKSGKYFTCYKFRTMYKDADERLENILAEDNDAKEEWHNHWKLKNDPRVTLLGNFLRQTSLDELPQIINILKGDMSLVGPRPYIEREWQWLKDYSETIHSVPPGITGLWQVSGRSDSSYRQRLELDSWYVRNWNLWLDIIIIIKTIFVVLKKEGAR
jgi:Undecaprenyl-phosphate galactose phosphotransferase WbaP